MKHSLLVSALFIAIAAGAIPSAKAAVPDNCVSITSQWNGAASQSYLVVHNSCGAIITMIFVAGDNSGQLGRFSLSNGSTQIYLTKEGTDAHGGYSAYACLAPQVPVDGNGRPVTVPVSTADCMAP